MHELKCKNSKEERAEFFRSLSRRFGCTYVQVHKLNKFETVLALKEKDHEWEEIKCINQKAIISQKSIYFSRTEGTIGQVSR